MVSVQLLNLNLLSIHSLGDLLDWDGRIDQDVLDARQVEVPSLPEGLGHKLRHIADTQYLQDLLCAVPVLFGLVLDGE